MMYIIKNVGFVNLDKEYGIVNSLKMESESLVFQRCDTKISELTNESYNELKEEYFEGYCYDTIGLRFEEHMQIKFSIAKFLIDNKILQDTHPMGMNNADEYFKKMVDNHFNMYTYEVIDKIKDIIMEIAYCTETSYKKDFINERIIFKNNYYLDEEGMNKVGFTNIWYKPYNKDEILYAMKEEAIYAGLIINTKNQFDYSATSFCKIETDNDYDLYIHIKGGQKLNKKTLNIINEYGMQMITK